MRQWSRETSADFCRRMGWKVGTRLVGEEGYGATVIEITAIGERSILAKTISHAGDLSLACPEGCWTLSCRDWMEATAVSPTSGRG
jgi:hypothetical protein